MSIIERNGRYGVKVWDRGTKRYRWVGSFDTEAQARQAEIDAALRPGKDVPTVEQWARVWLSDYARPAPATQRTYRYAADQIKATIGALRLSDITRPEARRIANEWPRSTTRVARTMWSDAVRDGVCDLNPWTNLRLETPRGRKDLDALSESQIMELADLACELHGDYGEEARAIILTAGFVGVRGGEVCSLRRSDLDAARGEWLVRFSVDATGKEKAPKNGEGDWVAVPSLVIDAVQRVPAHIRDDLAFHTLTGKPLKKGSLYYIWRPVAKAWEQRTGKHITPHELRHACATLLMERGALPEDVAVQLRHKDGGRLVQELYGHPRRDRARDRIRLAFGTQPDVRNAERRSA